LPFKDVELSRNSKTIEWLKTELLNRVAALHHNLLQRREEEVTESLADIIITSYLLARRLGITFPRLDGRITAKLRINIEEPHQVESWFGDLTALRTYLAGDREET